MGSWLATDDTTGFTKYGEELKLDFWGNRTAIPLERNLQEIAQPLDDPMPIPFFRGSNYQITNGCLAETAPLFVGLTNVRTNTNNAAIPVLGLNPSLGDMSVGCSFRVY